MTLQREHPPGRFGKEQACPLQVARHQNHEQENWKRGTANRHAHIQAGRSMDVFFYKQPLHLQPAFTIIAGSVTKIWCLFGPASQDGITHAGCRLDARIPATSHAWSEGLDRVHCWHGRLDTWTASSQSTHNLGSLQTSRAFLDINLPSTVANLFV